MSTRRSEVAGRCSKFEHLALLRTGPEIEKWIRRRITMCYWKQWPWVSTKVRHLLALGTRPRQAIFKALSRKSNWHLPKTMATQAWMTSRWLESEELIRVRYLWIYGGPPFALSPPGRRSGSTSRRPLGPGNGKWRGAQRQRMPCTVGSVRHAVGGHRSRD